MTTSESDRPLRVLDRSVTDLADDELAAELQRRRRARATPRRSSPADVGSTSVDTRSAASAAVARHDAGRYFAMLELPPTASADAVEKRYRELQAKYDPERHAADPDKHRTAKRLASELTRAYEALLEHLRR
jgi:DnaJ-domain-containing protein 1